MLGATVVWLFLADPFLATLGLLVVPAILVLNLVFQRRVERPTTLGQERLGDMSAVAHESFDGALVVKALQAEEAEGRRFADKAELLRDARIEAARVTANFEASLDALPALTTVALLVIGVWRIEQGAITAGTLVGLINLFALLIWPLRLIGYVLGDMPRAVAGYERVAAVLAEPLPAPPGAAAGPAGEALPQGPLDLEVAELGYGYGPGAEVLREVSFRVPAGGTVALVGPTGSGKSTLALLLARLLPPDRGRIRLGGRDLGGLDNGDRLPGAVPVLDLGARQHPPGAGGGRRGGRGQAGPGRGVRGPAPRGPRHRGRRARGHPVRWPAPAGRPGQGPGRAAPAAGP
jgi:ABC-type multidrug transport system fused ATPase/permease subunit